MIDQICNTVLKGYSPWEVIPFIAIVFGALWIDLKAHNRDEPVSLKNAAIWSVIWVAVSVGFAGYIMQNHGIDKASLFLSGYLLEKSLSVDNLFVFMAIFASFGIKDGYQHRILYFGILGALILRFVFVAAGTSLLLLGDWVLLGFGILVLWSAYQMFKAGGGDDDEEIEDYTDHWSVRIAKKFFSVHPHRDGHKFFTKQNNKLLVTPLFLCLVAVEVSDVMFAFDSVPAVIAITQEPFLVYTSNIFAILGLRSMYFLLTAAKRYLCHLEKAVIVILVFIGCKMIAGFFGYPIPANISLMIVLGLLVCGVLASKIFPEPEEDESAA
jgi:tellurite resistance protein TerC